MPTLTRRRLMTHAVGLAGATLIPWSAYRYMRGEPPVITVDYAGMQIGHQLRDAPFQQKPSIIYECNTLIIGSGAAALTAAWQLKKNGHTDIVMIEGPEPNGNNAGAKDGEGDKELSFPTGAHYLALPSIESMHVRELLADLGVLQSGIDQPLPVYDELVLAHAPEERLWYQQQWSADLLPVQDADSQRFFELINTLANSKGNDQKSLFVIPSVLSSQDDQWRQLDKITFEQWLNEQAFQSETLRWYLNYCCLDDYGQGIDRVSAWAGLHYFAARQQAQAAHSSYLVWPDGLATLSNKMREFVGFKPIDLMHYRMQGQVQPTPQSLTGFVSKVIEHQDHVEVWVANHDQHGVKTACFKAQQVISAMPLYIASHVIDNIQQYGFDPKQHLPSYAPWLVSNFILKQYPVEPHDEPLAWDNVVYQGQGLGYVVATHQWIRVAKPDRTAFTAYTALDFDQAKQVRYWLRTATQDQLLEKASSDLISIYGDQFWQSVERVNITVRGHAMASPTLNHLQNKGLLALQQHRSRVLFAHSDLSGYSIFEEAAWWGYQAAQSILKRSEGNKHVS
jgi:hypothetical protein